MRIAVWHNLPYGGAKRALFEHLKALKEEGNFVEIWTTDFHIDQPLDLQLFGKQHVISMGLGAENLHSRYKNPMSIIETRKTIDKLKEVQKYAADQINSLGFDVAFVNSCSVSYMPFISEFLSIPSILYLGEPYRWLYEASPENIWQAGNFHKFQLGARWFDYKITYSKRLQVRQEINAAKRYAKVLVNSFYSKESVMRAYGIEPEVCKLGVDTELFNNTRYEEKENYVVGMGVLYAPKGTERAIYLVGKIRADIRPKLYWIANGVDGEYLKHVTLLAIEKGVDFEVLVNISQSNLVERLAKAKFMLYTPRLEPLGLAPLEANACGTFVIGIAEGGVRETIIHQRNGFLIDSIHDKKFPEYAETLLTDKELSVRLGSQARDFVIENWSFSHLKKNICNAINSVFEPEGVSKVIHGDKNDE